MWVPSRVGRTDNEMVADIATRIISTSTDLPVNDIKTSIKDKIYATGQKHWDSPFLPLMSN